MASYSVAYPDAYCFAQDYNTIVITDSDTETYGAEVTLTVTRSSTTVYEATYNGWEGGKTLTIEVSGILRAVVGDSRTATAVTLTLSGAVSSSASISCLNGSVVEVGNSRPLRRYWWSDDLSVGACIVSKYEPQYGYHDNGFGADDNGFAVAGTFATYKQHDIYVGMRDTAKTYSFATELVGMYADDNGVYKAFEILRWEDYHQGEIPIYVYWRDNYGVTRAWIFALVGESVGVEDGVEYMSDNDGFDRINGHYKSITIRESLADRDTRQYLLSLAHSSCIYVTTSAFSARHAVPADSDLELDLSAATADFDITLKIYRTEV